MRDRRTGLRWVGAAATPWAVAAGLLVSFTAAAGHAPGGGVSVAPFGRLDGALVPAIRLLARGAPALRLPPGAVEARLSIDLFSAGEDPTVSETPRADAKRAAPGDPFVERGRKGDPDPALRPSLTRRAGEVAAASLGRLLFTAERGLPPAPLVAAPGPDPEAEPAFEPWSPTDPTRTVIASSVQSPAAAAQGSTGAARSSLGNGATPTVARAVALSSTTPAPADATPVEIAAAPVSLSGPFTRIDRSGRALAALPVDPAEKPRYADLVVPENLDREQRCLAEAVYFEARSEPEEGQAAVAQVVLNRARSGLYPSSVCGVVYQNRHRHLACQFTFACEGKSLRITDGPSWRDATRIAKAVLEGRTYLAEVGGSTHYHADYVKPSWSRRLKKMDVIGRHIFYKLKPGQT
jgi:spore germination cell wall hydrolase CwlJ-like protein